MKSKRWMHSYWFAELVSRALQEANDPHLAITCAELAIAVRPEPTAEDLAEMGLDAPEFAIDPETT